MTTPSYDTDAIVREVVRRLTALADSGQPAAAAPAANAAELRLADRVVTLASLDGRLHNVRSVVIGPKAILSPAVRDELKARGITVVRGDTRGAARQRQVLLATDVEETVCLREWEKNLAGGVTRVESRCREAIAARLGPWVEAGGIAVWWTARPARSVCDANRDGRVRAYQPVDGPSLQEALSDAAVNVLVFDVRHKRAHDWKQWIELARRHTPADHVPVNGSQHKHKTKN